MYRRMLITLLVVLLLSLVLIPAVQAAPAASGGYWYTVQPSDTWIKLSQRTGLPVATLQAANPAHIHPPYHWLYVGHKLWIPAGQPWPPPPPSCDYWYSVQYGDSWTRVSARTGVSVAALQAANPAKVRPPHYWLYAGEQIYIPCGHPPPPPPACMYYYTVQPGDSWYRVSYKTGVPVSYLKAANPDKVRPPHYWLYTGEVLCIPDP